MNLPFILLLSSVSRTASGNGDFVDLTRMFQGILLGSPVALRVQSDVTAANGTTPSMTMLVEDSVDGGQTWNTIGTFTAQTAVNRAVIQIAPSGIAQAAGFAWPFNPRYIRCRWTITGTTPSFTSTVKAVVI